VVTVMSLHPALPLLHLPLFIIALSSPVICCLCSVYNRFCQFSAAQAVTACTAAFWHVAIIAD